jgi:hypothetical protein
MNINTYLTLIINSPNSYNLIYKYLGTDYNLFPQLGLEGSPNTSSIKKLITQNQIQIKWLDEHLISRNLEPWQNITTWYLSCLLYNNIPIALLRNTSTTEDYYPRLLVIDRNNYYYAASYLSQFIVEDPGPNLEPYDVVGSFSGDIISNIKQVSIKSYDLNNINDLAYLNQTINYTVEIH